MGVKSLAQIQKQNAMIPLRALNRITEARAHPVQTIYVILGSASLGSSCPVCAFPFENYSLSFQFVCFDFLLF